MARTVKELQQHFTDMIEKGYGEALVDFIFVPEDGEDVEELAFNGCVTADDTGEVAIIHAIMRNSYEEQVKVLTLD